MTLTTERLKTIAAWRAKYGAGHNVVIPAEEAEAIVMELLANREAQPVARVDRRPAASGGICWQHGGKDLPHGTELFTAPPAPAVPEEMKRDPDADVFDPGFMNGWNACRAAMLAAAPEGWNG